MSVTIAVFKLERLVPLSYAPRVIFVNVSLLNATLGSTNTLPSALSMNTLFLTFAPSVDRTNISAVPPIPAVTLPSRATLTFDVPLTICDPADTDILDSPPPSPVMTPL